MNPVDVQVPTSAPMMPVEVEGRGAAVAQDVVAQDAHGAGQDDGVSETERDRAERDHAEGQKRRAREAATQRVRQRQQQQQQQQRVHDMQHRHLAMPYGAPPFDFDLV